MRNIIISPNPCLMPEVMGSTRYDDITCDAVVTIVSLEHHHDGPQCYIFFFKECDVATKVSNAAPRSCHHPDDNTLK